MMKEKAENSAPQFNILNKRQIEDIHAAVIQILEKAGMAFDSPEAVEIRLLTGPAEDGFNSNPGMSGRYS